MFTTFRLSLGRFSDSTNQRFEDFLLPDKTSESLTKCRYHLQFLSRIFWKLGLNLFIYQIITYL